MLVLTMTQAFNLLSQLGVEQFQIFSAEQRALDVSLGEAFDRDSISWSMLSGTLFAGILGLAAPWLVGLFSTGFSVDEQMDALRIFYPLLLQVCVAPAMFVVKQQMLLADKKLLATILGWSLGAAQLVVLVFCFVCSIVDVNYVSSSTGVFSLILCGVIVWFWSGTQVFKRLPDLNRLWPFIKASASMRSTHSIHNFFVVLITNNALSVGVEGTLSVFQYVKRVADGLASVSFAPHAAVFHARQAEAWAREQKVAFFENVQHYLQTSFLALLILSLGAVVVAAIAILWFGMVPSMMSTNNLCLFVLMLLWQLMISVETVPVGVIMMEKRSLQVFCVNAIFLLMLFILTHDLMRSSMTGLKIGGVLLVSQALSFCIFSFLAIRLFRLKYR